jgi:hypothetical protein
MLGIGSNITSKVGFINSKKATAATFVSGSSDFITLSNHADFQVATGGGVGSDFSVSFWIKLTVDASGTSDKDGYVGLKAGVFRGGGFYMWYNDASGDDESLELFTSTTSAQVSVSTDTDLDHNVWYHIAATYDVSTTTGKIYVDGVLSATNTSLTAPTQYTGAIDIGSSDAGSKFVSSVTSEVAYWKAYILTDYEVLALAKKYVNPKVVSPSYLKAYWTLDQLSETGSNNVLDFSGNDHHGTTSGLADADFDTTDTPTGV